jgi:hypothetical protein
LEAGESMVEGGKVMERISFRGHPMIRSLHPTTIEITTEEHLSPRGDCIIGVGAQKGCSRLDPAVKSALRREGTAVVLRFMAGGETFIVKAKGDPRLELSHPHDMVVRRSDFVSDRTLAVGADFAARDLPRTLIGKLKDPRTVGVLEIEVG